MLSSLVKHDEPKTSQVLITCPNNAKRQLDCEYSIYISKICMFIFYICLSYAFMFYAITVCCTWIDPPTVCEKTCWSYGGVKHVGLMKGILNQN